MGKVRKIYFEKADDVPSSTLLLYRPVLASHAPNKANVFRKRVKSSGSGGIWTDTIYDYTHFHSNTHEVLALRKAK